MRFFTKDAVGTRGLFFSGCFFLLSLMGAVRLILQSKGRMDRHGKICILICIFLS